MNANIEYETELYLTDLIDVTILQQIQDAFSDMSGMAALTTDNMGVAVTKGSNFTDFCMHYTRQSELGCQNCGKCDKHGAEVTLSNGKPCSYYCHAGLVDFAAPIMANGKMVGSFIGGQVLTSPPDLEKFRRIALELGIDPDEYVEAVKKVPIVDKATVDKAAHSLYVFANVLSDIAYKSHKLYISNIEIEKASNLKSDFLANMSHEIRTPMNAVLGMVDLALREEMSSAAKDFLHQIKVSGRNLLVIINDILDFSKIESGKMEIIPDNYELFSVINDVANIISTRIGNKDIEFTMDIAPDLPKSLFGDHFRIHQILINLLNNAVKFTQRGEINLKVGYELRGQDEALLKIEVRDTGIGIKKTDLNKLFNSFQQVDSKRNRNVEGTGLGLAISKQLLNLMGGNINVISEYEVGTTFFVEIPQKIINSMPSVPPLEKTIKVALRCDNAFFKKQLIRDLKRVGAECIEIIRYDYLREIKPDYLLIDKSLITDDYLNYIEENRDMVCVEFIDFADKPEPTLPNIHCLRKPVYSLGLFNAMGICHIRLFDDSAESEAFIFTAPDAHILIVDDNAVNLTVAAGLIAPLNMQVDTATSAKEAIDKLNKQKYDLIFMDHMMPEVDGIEATHIIRRLMPSYNEVPIIALTANAVTGSKEMFIAEGMNDFVAKPIEIKSITSKLYKWLPKEKVIPVDTTNAPELITDSNKSEQSKLQIEGLCTEQAVELLGSTELYMSVLKEYYSAIDKKSKLIEEHFESERWHEYTIEVHSLKSTSRQIGAVHVSELAAELEQAGHDGRIDVIKAGTETMLTEYRSLKKLLQLYFPDAVEQERRYAEQNEILAMLSEIQEAVDNFDTLQIDEVIEKMSAFYYADEQQKCFDALKQAAEIGDIDSCAEITKAWREINENLSMM